MNSTTHAQNAAGNAAVARASVRHALGYAWPTVTPCTIALVDSSANTMAFMAVTGNKRQQPRRLGQRTT
ncbi:MAG: hypothetical protein JWM34_4193 [Ilumatobacteraceae bacterium]|nr:hypothetical protein [Ilumatobacteraceae bacterium]